MTMSDVAALARVQRPVVSVWRSRAAATEIPFPAPVTHDRGQDLFDAALIGAWLAETGSAKLRSSIKRLLVKYGYPPDKQLGAIKLVMEQMESMAPRYSEARTGAGAA
jgi:hypothetical protein